MAANDYYRQSFMAQSQQSLPPKYNKRPMSHTAYAYDNTNSTSSLDQSRPSNTYSPHRKPYYDRYDTQRPPPQSPSSESIPLEQQARINTNLDNWRHQSTHYPPSPESQTPQLLPTTDKKKNKWFSGKVPWVVYTLSLIQITVFIVEIIKNCE